jgi:hypothetical protein
MPNRRRKAELVNASNVLAKTTEFATIYNKPATFEPKLTSMSDVLANNASLVSNESMAKVKNLLFTIDNINIILTFYNNAHDRIYTIFDMLIAKRDITDIISYARNLRGYMTTEIENLSGISGTTAESDLFDNCKYLLLDILDDIIAGVEMNIILRRIYYLREVLAKARIEYDL